MNKEHFLHLEDACVCCGAPICEGRQIWHGMRKNAEAGRYTSSPQEREKAWMEGMVVKDPWRKQKNQELRLVSVLAN